MDLAKNVTWHVSAVLACALLKNEESARVFTLALQCLLLYTQPRRVLCGEKDMRINKMPVRPQAASETKRDKENGREARQGKPKNGAYGREPKKGARTQEIQKNISKKMLQCSNQSEALASYSIEKQNGGSLHDGTGVTRAL